MPEPKKLNREIDFSKVIEAGMQSGSTLSPIQLAGLLDYEKTNFGSATTFKLNEDNLSQYTPEVKNKIKDLYTQTQAVYGAYKQAGAFPIKAPRFGKNKVMELFYPNMEYSKGIKYDAPDLEFYWNGSMVPSRNMTSQEIRDIAPFYLDTKANEIKSLDKTKLEQFSDGWSFSNIGQSFINDPLKAIKTGLGIELPNVNDSIADLGFSTNPKLAVANYGDIAKLNTEEGKAAAQMLALGIVNPRTEYKKKADDGAEYYLWKTLDETHDSFQEEVRSVWGPKTMYHNNYFSEGLEAANDFLMNSLDGANFIFNYAPKKIIGGLGSRYLFDGTFDKQIEKEYNAYNAWSSSRKSQASEEDAESWTSNPINFTKGIIDGAAQLALTLATGGLGKGLVWGMGKASASLSANNLLKLSARRAQNLVTVPATAYGYSYAASAANKEARQAGINPEAAMIMSGIAAAAIAGSERLTGGNWVKKLLGKDIAQGYGSKIAKELTTEVMRANRLNNTSLITSDVLNSEASKGAIKKVLGAAYDYISKDAETRTGALLQGFLKEGVQELTEDSINKLSQAGFNLVGDITKKVGLDWINDKERYKIETNNLFEDLLGSFVIGGIVGGGAGAMLHSKPKVDEQLENNRSYWLVDLALKGEKEQARFFEELEDMKKNELLGIADLSAEVDKDSKNGLVRKLLGNKATRKTSDLEIDDNEFNYNLFKAKAEFVFGETARVSKLLEDSIGEPIDRANKKTAGLISDILGLSQEPTSNEGMFSIKSLLPEYNTNVVTIKDSEGNLVGISQERYDEITQGKSIEEINKNFKILTPLERAQEEARILTTSLNQAIHSESIFVKSQLEKTNNRIAHLLQTKENNADSKLAAINPDNIISYNGNMKAIKREDSNEIDNTEAYFDKEVKLEFSEAQKKLRNLEEDKDIRKSINSIKDLEKQLEELEFRSKREPELREFLDKQKEDKLKEIEVAETQLHEQIEQKGLVSSAKIKDLVSLLRTKDTYNNYLTNNLTTRLNYFKTKSIINAAAFNKLGNLISKAAENGVSKRILSPYTKEEKDRRKRYYVNRIKSEEQAAKKLNEEQKLKSTELAKKITESKEGFTESIAEELIKYFEENPLAGRTQELSDLLIENVTDISAEISKLFQGISQYAVDEAFLIQLDGQTTVPGILNSLEKQALAYKEYNDTSEVIEAASTSFRLLSDLLNNLNNKNISSKLLEIKKALGTTEVFPLIQELITLVETEVENVEELLKKSKFDTDTNFPTPTIYEAYTEVDISNSIEEFIQDIIRSHSDNTIYKNIIEDFKSTSDNPKASRINFVNRFNNKLQGILKRDILGDVTQEKEEDLEKEFYLNDHSILIDNRNIAIPTEIENNLRSYLLDEWDEIDVNKLTENVKKLYEPLLSIVLDHYVDKVNGNTLPSSIFNEDSSIDRLLLDRLTSRVDEEGRLELEKISRVYQELVMYNASKVEGYTDMKLEDFSAFSRAVLSILTGEQVIEKVGLKLKSRLVQDTEYRAKYLDYYSKLLKEINSLLDEDDETNTLLDTLSNNIIDLETELGIKLNEDLPTEEGKSKEVDSAINVLLSDLKTIELQVSNRINKLPIGELNTLIRKVTEDYSAEAITNLYKTENGEIESPLMPRTKLSTEELEAKINFLQALYTNKLDKFYTALHDTVKLTNFNEDFISTFEQQQVTKGLYSLYSNNKRNAFHKELSAIINEANISKKSVFYNDQGIQRNVKSNKDRIRALSNMMMVRGYAGVGKTTFVIKEIMKILSQLEDYKGRKVRILVSAPGASQLETIGKSVAELQDFLKQNNIDNIEISLKNLDYIKSTENLSSLYDSIIIDEATLVSRQDTMHNITGSISLLDRLIEFGKPVILTGDEIQKSNGDFGSSPWTRGNPSAAFYIPRTTSLVNPMRTGKIDSFNLQKNLISSIVELSKLNEIYIRDGVDYVASNKDIIKLLGSKPIKVSKSNFANIAARILINTLYKPTNTRFSVKSGDIEEGVRVLKNGLSNSVASYFKTHIQNDPNSGARLIVINPDQKDSSGEEKLKEQIRKQFDLPANMILTATEAQGKSIEHVYLYTPESIDMDSSTLLMFLKDLFVGISREKKSVTLSLPSITGVDSAITNGVSSISVANNTLINKFTSSLGEDGKINQDLLNRQISTVNLLELYTNNINNISDDSSTEEVDTPLKPNKQTTDQGEPALAIDVSKDKVYNIDDAPDIKISKLEEEIATLENALTKATEANNQEIIDRITPILNSLVQDKSDIERALELAQAASAESVKLSDRVELGIKLVWYSIDKEGNNIYSDIIVENINRNNNRVTIRVVDTDSTVELNLSSLDNTISNVPVFQLPGEMLQVQQTVTINSSQSVVEPTTSKPDKIDKVQEKDDIVIGTEVQVYNTKTQTYKSSHVVEVSANSITIKFNSGTIARVKRNSLNNKIGSIPQYRIIKDVEDEQDLNSKITNKLTFSPLTIAEDQEVSKIVENFKLFLEDLFNQNNQLISQDLFSDLTALVGSFVSTLDTKLNQAISDGIIYMISKNNYIVLNGKKVRYNRTQVVNDFTKVAYDVVREYRQKYIDSNENVEADSIVELLDHIIGSIGSVKIALSNNIKAKIDLFNSKSVNVSKSTRTVISEETSKAEDRNEQEFKEILMLNGILTPAIEKQIDNFSKYVLGVDSVKYTKADIQNIADTSIEKQGNKTILNIIISTRDITDKSAIMPLIAYKLTNSIPALVDEDLMNYIHFRGVGRVPNSVFYSDSKVNFASMFYPVVTKFFSAVEADKLRLNSAINLAANNLPKNKQEQFKRLVSEDVFSDRIIRILSQEPMTSKEKLEYNKLLFSILKQIYKDPRIADVARGFKLINENGESISLLGEITRVSIETITMGKKGVIDNLQSIINTITELSALRMEHANIHSSETIIVEEQNETTENKIENELANDFELNELVIKEESMIDLINTISTALDTDIPLDIQFFKNCL